VYDNYYKDWPQEYIIDRGPVLAKGNFELIKKHFKRPFKCIVLLRDLMDVLASFMKWYTENPDAFPNRFNLKNDDEKLSTFMSKEGGIAKELEAIKNAYNYPEICHFVKYDDLVAKPQEEIQKIYKFLEIPFFNHQFKDLKQININGMGYDDRIVGQDMHTIRSVIRKKYNPYIERIPERIKQKYGHIRF
jgi:hypothetical protein